MAKKNKRVALVGTDSMRGKEMKRILEKKGSPFLDVEFYDPGVEGEFSKLTEFRGEARIIHNLDMLSVSDTDLTLLAADRSVNKKFANQIEKSNFQCIDISETFNDEKNVPLVVSGVNDKEILKNNPPLVANPHPVSIILSHFIHVIRKNFHFERMVTTVLQPVSAFENPGIEELASQSLDLLGSGPMKKKVFKAQSAFNILSQTDTLDKNGFLKIERHVIKEINRIFKEDRLPLTLSIVQVPVFHTYALMTYIELDKRSDLDALRNLLEASPYFKVCPPNKDCPASPISVAGKDEIHISQIKRETALPNAFWIWMVADNLTRGSVLNAVEIAEQMALLNK
ncbi:Asd/ArgC dimerization domain-containing protein [Acidobacteriota bacterium]